MVFQPLRASERGVKSMMKKVFRQSLIGLVLVLPQTGTTAQEQTAEPKYFVGKSDGGACELNNLYIDLLAIEAKKSKERIFIISRLNRGEKYQLNWRRLQNAQMFLTDGKGVAPGQIVIAVGSKLVDRSGRLEVYLGSQFFLAAEAERGKGVCLNCCHSPY